jgi:hypothetical protein
MYYFNELLYPGLPISPRSISINLTLPYGFYYFRILLEHILKKYVLLKALILSILD